MLINQNSIVKDRDFDSTISLQNALAYIHTYFLRNLIISIQEWQKIRFESTYRVKEVKEVPNIFLRDFFRLVYSTDQFFALGHTYWAELGFKMRKIDQVNGL